MSNPLDEFPLLLKRERRDKRINAAIWAAIIIISITVVYLAAG